MEVYIFRVWILLIFTLFVFSGCNSRGSNPTILQVKERKISILGKEASIYTITQPNGQHGLVLTKGESFNVIVENHLDVPTSIHWHGLIMPNDQDGVAFITQSPIYPSQIYPYRFPIIQSGTYWMHAHYGLQIQKLYAAPLILRDPKDPYKVNQEVVLLLNDFTFSSPQKILSKLKCKNRSMQGSMSSNPDLTDVIYDAFLVNFRTIDDPDLISTKPGSKIRLRIINGSASSQFYLHLGLLQGEAIAVDGNPISPVEGSTFTLGSAQRIDILVTIPSQGGAFPIIAQGEGTFMQGGAILYTEKTAIPTLTPKALVQAEAISYSQETKFHALSPLPPKKPDRTVELVLGGSMKDYIWTINGQAWPESNPTIVKENERVEITFKNTTMMSHPMHLHGHVFQVTAINSTPIQGALRDTVVILPNSTMTIQFDANNPGVWPLHCHLLYHDAAGMFTVVRYE